MHKCQFNQRFPRKVATGDGGVVGEGGGGGVGGLLVQRRVYGTKFSPLKFTGSSKMFFERGD